MPQRSLNCSLLSISSDAGPPWNLIEVLASPSGPMSVRWPCRMTADAASSYSNDDTLSQTVS